MRYLLLAVSVAILFTPAACVVHVDGTAPATRPSSPPTAQTHPPLSEVAVIYVDQWGISEPQYWYLRDDLHLSDEDIGVVLFLSHRSSWNWRRIAFQRRAGHDWQAITRMVGLTPLVYFVDIPRGSHLGNPYHGLYDQYWRYHDQPQRIHLHDPDCVAMARLHLVHERYGYDPVAYMAPTPNSNHQGLLQELEHKHRTGELQTGPRPEPVAHETIRNKGRIRHEAVNRRHGPPAESDGATREARGVGRGVVAHGANQSPDTKEPPGAAVSRSSDTSPGHAIKSKRVKAMPPGRSGEAHVAEQGHGRQQEPAGVASHTKPLAKGVRRPNGTANGQPHDRGAVARSNAAAVEESNPLREGGPHGKQEPTSATTRNTGTAHRHTNSPGPAKTVASERDTPASRPDKGSNNNASSHRPTADTPRAAVTDHGRNENQRGTAGRGTDAKPVAQSASPAPRKHDRATSVADEKANDKEQIKQNPMYPGSSGCIRIIANKSKSLCSLGCI